MQATENELAEWERLWRSSFESAMDKLGSALDATRFRPPSFRIDELRAIRQFVRKYYT